MTFWYGPGSGSADPCLWLIDLDTDPDPAIFVIDLQGANKKLIFCLLLFEGTFTSFFKDKKSKRSHKTVEIKGGFSYYYCLMIEGSGSGSIPLTSGSGSGKSMWIRWIRIRNTANCSASGLHNWIKYLSIVRIWDKKLNIQEVFQKIELAHKNWESFLFSFDRTKLRWLFNQTTQL